jgi:hypothetical protein
LRFALTLIKDIISGRDIGLAATLAGFSTNPSALAATNRLPDLMAAEHAIIPDGAYDREIARGQSNGIGIALGREPRPARASFGSGRCGRLRHDFSVPRS